MKRPACIAVAILVLLYATEVRADAPVPPPAADHLVWTEPTVLCWPGLIGCVALAPGYYLSTPKFNILDTEMRRLQDQETRLIAENNSLRSSADSVPWPVLAVAASVGLCLGIYIGYKL